MAGKKKISGKEVLEELKTPALMIIGMIGGSLGGKMVDKVLKVDEVSPGVNMKSLAKPVIQLSTGIAGAVLLKDKNLKLVASGFAASGVASTVKVLLKKDILNGLDGMSNSDYNLLAERYDPNLPELISSDKIEAVHVESDKGNSYYDNYTEVDEVEII